MRKYMLVIIIFILISLAACSSQAKLSLNNYIKSINTSNSLTLNIDDFVFTSKDDEYIYKNMINKSTLLCVYCNEKGEILQITITATGQGELFNSLCKSSIGEFCEINAQKSAEIFSSSIKSGKCEYGKFLIAYNDYKIGKTLIINYADNTINSNENPTLKGYINEDDITRPRAN